MLQCPSHSRTTITPSQIEEIMAEGPEAPINNLWLALRHSRAHLNSLHSQCGTLSAGTTDDLTRWKALIWKRSPLRIINQGLPWSKCSRNALLARTDFVHRTTLPAGSQHQKPSRLPFRKHEEILTPSTDAGYLCRDQTERCR